MQSIVVTGETFGFCFDLEVSDFSLGIVASRKAFMGFVSRVRVRFRTLRSRGGRLLMLFGDWLASFPLRDRLARQRLKSS
jgi:hypothetical protein